MLCRFSTWARNRQASPATFCPATENRRLSFSAPRTAWVSSKANRQKNTSKQSVLPLPRLQQHRHPVGWFLTSKFGERGWQTACDLMYSVDNTTLCEFLRFPEFPGTTWNPTCCNPQLKCSKKNVWKNTRTFAIKILFLLVVLSKGTWPMHISIKYSKFMAWTKTLNQSVSNLPALPLTIRSQALRTNDSL